MKDIYPKTALMIECQKMQIAFWKAAKLPKAIGVSSDIEMGKTQSFPVSVPKGFETLFKSVTLAFDWQLKAFVPTRDLVALAKLPRSELGNKPTCTVKWAYSHPGFGQNGYTVGYFGQDPNGEWRFQLDASENKGWQELAPFAEGI